MAKAKFKVGADVNCEKAWERSTGDPSIVVAVLDEGIYWRHPDLINIMWITRAKPTGLVKTTTGTAMPETTTDTTSSTTPESSRATPRPTRGHGTHVAGVIAARQQQRNRNRLHRRRYGRGARSQDHVVPDLLRKRVQQHHQPGPRLQVCRRQRCRHPAVQLGIHIQRGQRYENTPGFATQEEWEAACPLEKASLDYFVYNAGSPNGPIEGGIPIFSSGNEYAPAAGFPGAAEYCISVNSIAADYTISTFSNYGTFSDIAARAVTRTTTSTMSTSAKTGRRTRRPGVYRSPRCRGMRALDPAPAGQRRHLLRLHGGYLDGLSSRFGCGRPGTLVCRPAAQALHGCRIPQLIVESVTPIDEYLTGDKKYYHYVTDLGKTYPRIIEMSQYAGKSGGLVNADSFWPPSKTNRPARRSPSRTSTSESARKTR